MKISDVNLNDLDCFEKATPHECFTLLPKEEPFDLHKGPDGEQDDDGRRDRG